MSERRDINMSIRMHWRRNEEMFRRYEMFRHLLANATSYETDTYTYGGHEPPEMIGYTEGRWNDRWLLPNLDEHPDLETDLEEQFRNRIRNPEQDVLDDIDQLMADQLEHDGLNEETEDKCPVCEDDWHGLPKYGCPGEYGTDEEKRAYRNCEDDEHHGRGFDDDPPMRLYPNEFNRNITYPDCATCDGGGCGDCR
jgi:hypothetical protein